jgi:hypothetical protein
LHPELEGKRWEKWVTVMSFDDSTRKSVDSILSQPRADYDRLDYATSFYDGEETGITVQDVDIRSIEVLSIAALNSWEELNGERAPDYRPTSGELAQPPAPTA